MPIPTRAEFAKAAFLIYSHFTTKNKISGSLLLDCALTELEAQEKKAMYEQRSADFYKECPTLRDDTTRWIVYSENKAYWWTSKPAELPSAPPSTAPPLS
jgi:hypothetical protein